MKKIKVWIAILFVVLLSCIAFLGFFKKENGVWKNEIPDYEYGMDVEGARELIYTLDNTEENQYVYVDEQGEIKGEVWKEGKAITQEDDTEESSQTQELENQISYTKETRTIKKNPDEKLTKENFEEAKKIIQNRLKGQKLSEYHIRLDDVTGKLVIENANDEEQIKLVEQFVSSLGKFQLIDYQNGLVLMDNSDIKKVSAMSSNNQSYTTYLQIQFNEKGTEKLKEISKEYVEVKKEATQENTEENAEDTTEETEKKYVSLVLDGTTMMTTYFGEEMTTGILQITVGQPRTEYSDFLEDYHSAKIIADILNSGVLPVNYTLKTDNFVQSNVILNTQNVVKIIACVVVLLISFVYVAKYKINGVIVAILNIGYIALLSIVLRYTNVQITINAMIAIAMMIIINYVFVERILKEWQTQKMVEAYKKVSKKFYLAFIPVIVAAVVFTLTAYYAINSVGMVVFWGIVLQGLYHLIVTRTVLKSRED